MKIYLIRAKSVIVKKKKSVHYPCFKKSTELDAAEKIMRKTEIGNGNTVENL